MSWFDDLANNAKNSIDQAWTDFKEAGVPALTAAAEKYAADLLTKQAEESSKTAQIAIGDILKRPSVDGVGNYIKQELQSPIIKEYGGLAVGGMVAVGIAALIIFSRRA